MPNSDLSWSMISVLGQEGLGGSHTPTLIFDKSGLGTRELVSLTFMPGKIMEQILLEDMLRYVLCQKQKRCLFFTSLMMRI